MDELRSEIRAAFEKEQAAHPPAGSLRSNLTAAAATQSRPARNLQWIAVAVAAVLGILVVAGLMSTRLGHRASVPAATPPAGAVKDYGPPPAGVPLMYLIDSRNGAWLQAYDWQGQPRGTVKLALPVVSGYRNVFAAPDGSGFVYQPQGEGGVTQHLDRLGRPIASVLLPSNGSPYPAWGWADDSRHLCVIRFESPSGEWRLLTMLPGEADHLVGIIPPGPNIDQAAISQTAFSLASCSFHNDQAIVVRTTSERPSELWVFRISDGKVLSDITYSNPGPVAAVVASDDGVFIAEMTVEPGAAAPSAIIRRVSDRSVVASLASVAVVAFSGDDSLVLVSNRLPHGPDQEVSVIDVRSGNALWQHGQVPGFVGFVEPGRRDFAIGLAGPTAVGSTGPLFTFLIIHGDGSVTTIPGSYTPA